MRTLLLTKSLLYRMDYDFSFMNKITTLFMIFRSFITLLVFISGSFNFALLIYALTWILDSLDDNVIEWSNGIKLKFNDGPRINAYNIVDKIADFIVRVIFVFWSLQYLPVYSSLLLGLLAYRLIGIFVFHFTKRDSWLVLFPDMVHYLFGILLLQKILLISSTTTTMIVLSLILALISELITHVIKPEFMEKY